MSRFTRNGKQISTIGKLVVGGCAIFALAFSTWTAAYLVATEEEATYIYLPIVLKVGYYVDSVNGSDANPGTSEGAPWRTLAPVHAMDFPPGSTVYFKRGSSWTGGLVIDDSGLEGQPITFTTYGAGDRPIFSNPGDPDNWTRAVVIDADWVVVEGILVRDAHQNGIYILEGSDNNIVRDIEATHVGTGITIGGRYNLVTHNYLHDLHMVRNTPGGDDDSGAVGVKLYNSYNEVSYNRIENCIAPSYDYGVDGGGVEWWGDVDGSYIHHNWVTGSAGFLEVGGGSVRDTIVAYNVSINNGRFSSIHLSGRFASDVENFGLENNTIVEIANDDPGWAVLGFEGEPTVSTFFVRNNIFYIDGFKFISNESSFIHDHNLYYLGGGTELGFALGQGEIFADPLFVNLAGEDFHLLAASLAIDAGVDLGYTLDFEDGPVPVGAAPDLGAFEYGSGIVIVPTPTSTISPNERIYEVYTWWWEGSWRPTDVPYAINHLNGSTTVRVK